MSKNRSISKGIRFDQFVQNQTTEGVYKNGCEVIRDDLRLSETEENKARTLKNIIQEGVDSGIAEDFDPALNLKKLKTERKKSHKSFSMRWL